MAAEERWAREVESGSKKWWMSTSWREKVGDEDDKDDDEYDAA